MNPNDLSEDFWNQRYIDGNTGWDVGSATTPLAEYFNRIENKNIDILIPGAGKAHEAELLHKAGFSNVVVLDFAREALKRFELRVPDFPKSQLICGDFFEHDSRYDLIVEQTFFCALHPSLRDKYAQKVSELLKPKGRLVGLFFDTEFVGDKPPFGGHKEEYLGYFNNRFFIRKFEKAYNSIKPRQGNELFAIMEKTD